MDRPAYAGGAPRADTAQHRRTATGHGSEPARDFHIMTSKDNEEVSPEAATAYAARDALHARIREGHLPDVDQLLAGAPFFAGDIQRDIQVWCDSWLLNNELDGWQLLLNKTAPDILLRPVIQNLRDVGSVDGMKTVEHVMHLIDHDDADRMLIYLACSGQDASRQKLVSSAQRHTGWQTDDYDRLFDAATAIGMMYHRRRSMEAYCTSGFVIIKEDGQALARYQAAIEAAAAAEGQVDIERMKKAVGAVAAADADIIDDVLEDRAGIVRRPALEHIVMPKLPEGGTGHRKEIQRGWKGIDGVALPVVGRGDIAAHRRALVAAWPHAEELIDVVLTDLAVREEVRFKPTCFLGPAGSGKSSLARAICDQVGLPCELYSMAGMADASLGGTSAQWSTARESVPLQLIKRSKHASVAVVWDEVEKAGEGRHNGNALDTLLPMLEIDQAKRYRDLALEVECDLSLVSHFATANSLEGIPGPLRDRMRILVMPTPGWQHLGTLTKQIVDRIARERGVDVRWYAPLAEDELDLVRQAWPGGSIRQLTRIVTTLVDGRDRLIGRC